VARLLSACFQLKGCYTGFTCGWVRQFYSCVNFTTEAEHWRIILLLACNGSVEFYPISIALKVCDLLHPAFHVLNTFFCISENLVFFDAGAVHLSQVFPHGLPHAHLIIQLTVLNLLFEYIMHYVAQYQSIAYLRLFEHVLKNSPPHTWVRSHDLRASHAMVWIQNHKVITFVINNDCVFGVLCECRYDTDHITGVEGSLAPSPS